MPKNSVSRIWSILTFIAATLVVIATVVGLWYMSWQWIDHNVTSSDLKLATNEAARGTFGDKFGAVNALFSGLAFAGIIVTLILQRKDLAQQRIEIERTNEEMKKQSDSMRRQRFENTLFQMLALHSDILDKLIIKSSRQREAFSYFIELLKQHTPQFRVFHAMRKMSLDEIHELKSSKAVPLSALSKLSELEQQALNKDISNNLINVSMSGEIDVPFHEKLVNSAYMLAHEKSNDALSHYFRNLYNILRFIDESTDVSVAEKNIYARLVRAQLSDQELVALFYNCIAICAGRSKLELGHPKMTRLVKKYDILQNMNHESLIHSKHEQIFHLRAKSLEGA